MMALFSSSVVYVYTCTVKLIIIIIIIISVPGRDIFALKKFSSITFSNEN